MNLAPIALFVYNRPDHTTRTLTALKNNSLARLSELFVFLDGPKDQESAQNFEKIKAVKSIVESISGFQKINTIYRTKNLGLAENIKQGINYIFENFNSIIILEDDIETAPNFLQFMNEGLNYYQASQKIMHISGYVPESIFQTILPKTWMVPFMSCWGWATWKNRWEKIIWDADYLLKSGITKTNTFTLNNTINFERFLIANRNGSLKTWAIFWYSSIAFHKGLCIYPKYSLTRNIGLDGTGVNYNQEALESIQTHHPEYITEFKAQKSFSFQKTIKNSVFRFFYLSMFYKYQSRKLMNVIKIIIYNNLIAPIKKITAANSNYKWLGTEYGGFYVNPKLLSSSSIVYSVGIGEDTSFDDSILELCKCKIFAFDPTPKAIKYVGHKYKNNPNFIFTPVAISTDNNPMTFFLPKNEEHVSGSLIAHTNVNENKSITVEARTLKSVMDTYGHSKIDVLKMDVEGSEYEIIEYILETNIPIKQLLVEFHDRFTDNHNSKDTINLLKKHNFNCKAISQAGNEFTFVNSSVL